MKRPQDEEFLQVCMDAMKVYASMTHCMDAIEEQKYGPMYAGSDFYLFVENLHDRYRVFVTNYCNALDIPHPSGGIIGGEGRPPA